MSKPVYFWILWALLLLSCRKEAPSIVISGQVYNPTLDKPVEDARVIFKAARVVSGVYNPSFSTLADTRSGADGRYRIEIKKEQVSAYRLEVSKEDYFKLSTDIQPDVLEAKDTYTQNFAFYAKAYIHILINNSTPQGMDDRIQFHFSNIEAEGDESCNIDPLIGDGPTFSYDHTCAAYGERWIKFSWVVSKKGNQHLYKDSLFTESFKTKTYHINY